MDEELERWRRIESIIDGDADIAESDESIADRLGLRSGLPLLDEPFEEHFAALLEGALENVRGLHPGHRVGAYRIEKWIGEGGMGTVFHARRADGSFEQDVALKILHRGPADEASRRRFLQERQILAGLKHAHIARLLDGGLVDPVSDRDFPGLDVPFLVMEYVDGEPITEYCRRHALGTEAILRLVLQACDALRYAHREGVVHRDVKPSNLLVETDPQGGARLVVLDFGIAQVEGASIDATATGQVFGTPGYMSPEQSFGRRGAADRRSDVFSLGVVLYELLADAKPFEGRDAAEILERLLEHRLTPLQAKRGDLPADLLTIVDTCLKADPSARYDSMRALAEDLESFLDGRPIRARRESLVERLRRRARRHPRMTALIAAAVLLSFISLSAALVTAISYTRALEKERLAAVEARGDAEGLLDFMLRDLYAGLDRVGRLDLLEQVARKSLAYYEGRASETSDRQILGQARAITNSGQVLRSLGDLEGALAAYERNRYHFRGLLALEVRPSWQLELSRAHRLMASVYSAQGEVEPAIANARSAAALSGALSPEAPAPEPPLTGPVPETWAEVHFDNLLLLGWIQREAGDQAAAQATLEACRDFAAERMDKSTAARLEHGLDWRHKYTVALSYLGLVTQQDGDFEAALTLFQDAREQLQPQVAADPANTKRREQLQLVLSHLGWAQLDLGRYGEAAKTFRSALQESQALVDLEPANAKWLRELAVAYAGLGETLKADDQKEAALAPWQTSLGISRTLVTRFPDNLLAANDLAWDLVAIGQLRRENGQVEQARQDFEEAATILRSLRESSQRQLDDDAPGDDSSFFLDNYSLDIEVRALLELGRIDEARPIVEHLQAAGWDDEPFLELVARHGLDIKKDDIGGQQEAAVDGER